VERKKYGKYGRYTGTAYAVQNEMITPGGALKDNVVQRWLDSSPERTMIPRVAVPGMSLSEASLREIIAHNTKGKKIAE
jgi:hypothetical protein